MTDERNMVESMKRNRTLDITKGIGIIFMVLGHMHFSDNVFNYYVYAFHMPLFFIVSGMLFNENKSIKETVKSRAKSLLIPYLVFGGWYGVLYIVIKLRSHDIDAIISALKIMLLFPTESFPFESALWFLPVMFLTSVGYAVIRKYLDLRWATVVVAVIGIIGFAFPALASFRLPWGIDTACVALLFFHTGLLIKRGSLINRVKESRRNKSWLFWLCFSIVFVTNIALIYLNEKVNLRLIQYGNPVLTFVNAVLSTVIWMIIADVLASCRKIDRVNALLCEISKLSIIFLCTNHIPILIVGIILSKMFDAIGIQSSVAYNLVLFLFAMALMLFAGRIIDRTNIRVVLGRKRLDE